MCQVLSLDNCLTLSFFIYMYDKTFNRHLINIHYHFILRNIKFIVTNAQYFLLQISNYNFILKNYSGREMDVRKLGFCSLSGLGTCIILMEIRFSMVLPHVEVEVKAPVLKLRFPLLKPLNIYWMRLNLEKENVGKPGDLIIKGCKIKHLKNWLSRLNKI